MNTTARNHTGLQTIRRHGLVESSEDKILRFATAGTESSRAGRSFTLRGVMRGYLGGLLSWLGVFAVAAFVKGSESVPAWLLGADGLEFAEVRQVATLSTMAWLLLAVPGWVLVSRNAAR